MDIPQEILLHVINCIWPPDIIGITQAPNLLINQSSDIIRYYEGDLLNFLLALDDEQQKLVDFSLSGPTLVKGGPGSGKSTVALYRVGAIIRKYIAERKPVRILFTTYTNALISASNQLLQRILEMEKVDPNSEMVKLDVQTLDSVAMQILKSDPNHLMMSTGSDMKYSIASARSSFLPEGNNHSENININKSLAALRDEYLLEEFDWVIEGRGLSTLQEYLTTDRVGRGYSFDARIRRAVWQLYQRSRDFLHQLRQTTWGELRLKAIEKLLNGEWTDKWDYVFVDEAQDLTPVA
ncbi:MAG TPA: UvrD-helicase domain-containing protein [Bellilinea sp.]|nr:UvrD-helicase domain-containing protein [Bellilinea sp.]